MGNCCASVHRPLHNTSEIPQKDSAEIETETQTKSTPRTEGVILGSPNLQSFSFSDLMMATRNFRMDSLIGCGGFGSVFKGWIDPNTFEPAKPKSGILIAVKKLNQESFKEHKDLLAEVNYLSKFSHPNLVKLVGYCLEDEHKLLVYEFMHRGSLENHLFRRGSYFQPLSWHLRLKVALGVAKGLQFLHSSESKIIYRDLKASNILLDSDYNAKLSNFGLAKDCGKSHGYAAPEYLLTGNLTQKSDVYTFGVVLVELLSGRRATGEQKLIEWAKPYLGNKRRVMRVIDNRLEGQYTSDEVNIVANISLRCVCLDQKLRPDMEQVVEELEQVVNLKAINEDDIQSKASSRTRKRTVGDAYTKTPTTQRDPQQM